MDPATVTGNSLDRAMLRRWMRDDVGVAGSAGLAPAPADPYSKFREAEAKQAAAKAAPASVPRPGTPSLPEAPVQVGAPAHLRAAPTEFYLSELGTEFIFRCLRTPRQ